MQNCNLIWATTTDTNCSCFNKTFDKVKITVNNQVIVLDHYAHAVWEKSHRGAWHLYGHSHSNAEEWLNRVMPERRSVDVGVDNAFKILGDYRPFSFIELQKLFANKKGSFIDHHKEED
jgi:calcineurin-like phosphoesterase family protein